MALECREGTLGTPVSLTRTPVRLKGSDSEVTLSSHLADAGRRGSHRVGETQYLDETQYLADFNTAVARSQQQLVYAYMCADAQPWPERVRAAVAAFLAFLDGEPRVARILFDDSLSYESLRHGSSLAARRAHLLEHLSLHVHTDGSRAGGAPNTPGRSADEMIGVACTVIETHLMRDDPRPLVELTGTLTGLIVMPYLGVHAALEQMENELSADR
jgi:hypothetical protein